MDAFDHHRRSIHLRGYDYTRQGAYFITICVHQRQKLFGDVVNGGVKLNPAGTMLENIWYKIPLYYAGIDVDESIVMPNHLHGIVIVGAGPCACPNSNFPMRHPGQSQGVAPTRPLSLSDVVHRYKTMTTKQYVDGVNDDGWPVFNGKLWQRNY
jgi:REP element-mobilizing transposase RayT